MRVVTIAFACLSLACLPLAGCGGDSSSPPVNRPPVFSSAATVSVPENTTGPAYSAAATDPDGQGLTFAIAGGADAARFTMTPAGVLSFVARPDFEAPADADGDNAYLVTLNASDGAASATLNLTVTVTNATAGDFRVRRITTALSQPLFLTALPDDSGRVLVVQKGGMIRLVTPSTGAIAADPFLDVSGIVTSNGERGLLGLALAPDFMTSGRAYVYLTAAGGEIQLRRYTTLAGDRTRLDPASADVLLRIPHARTNHNGGWIGFGADGLLYVAVGDGGGANDPDSNGQNKATLLGKMLRLDVSRDDFPTEDARDYGIPAANPFATSGGAPEVWLYGLRNPFRNSFDRATGRLWIADVGQDAREEINLVTTAQAGLNMGWPLYEGTRPNAGSDPAGLTMPVTEYDHGSGPLQGESITGGYVYRGPVEQLQGLYVFADFVTGNIWSVPIASLSPGTTGNSGLFTNRITSFAPDAGTIANVTSFGEDQAGNLYVVSINGSLWAIEAAI
ncbi:MAG: PQQ-dependent sugar dehydrogenase [Sphingobium sp.]